MFVAIIVIIALIAVFLTLLVLLQSGKGGGLAGIASGGATTQILGARQAPDILEKATWTLATLFIMLCILSNFVMGGEEASESVIQQRARQGQTEQQAPVLPPAEAPLDVPAGAPADGATTPEDGN